MLLHATCIAIDGRAALLLGQSGAGKSDLALRLCTGSIQHGERRLTATLVADDQVLLERRGASLWAAAPQSIAGRIEARGVGILTLPSLTGAQVSLAVTLVHDRKVERFPDPPASFAALGLSLPMLELAPFEASTPAKIVLALLQPAALRR